MLPNHGDISKGVRNRGGIWGDREPRREILEDRNAEQKWRRHGRKSLRRPEITGDQPTTRLAFTREGTLVGGN